MARLLYVSDSAGYMLNVVRRHQRLSRKNPNGTNLITVIQAPAEALRDKLKKLGDAKIAREDAYDDVLLADMDLDNSIRDVFDSCKSYERKHAGETLLTRIFPNGTFADIVRMPYVDEPNAAEAVAVKIESLTPSHELYPLAATLRKNITAVRTAIDSHKEAIRQEKAQEAEVEIAKADVVRAYENNYLDARKTLRAAAERLFPVLAPKTKNDTVEDETDGSADKTA